MADEQHIEWLLGGVEDWNTRRETDRDVGPGDEGFYRALHLPDFSFANFWWEFLDSGRPAEDWPISLAGVDLVEADLSHAMLALVNLASADFVAADLTRTNLNKAVLTNADFQDANLTATHLQGADLTGADLRDAILRNTDLTNAILTGADLSTARIIGANLSGTEPWNAILYPNSKSPDQCQGEQIFVENIEGFLSEARKLKAHYDGHDEEVLIYFRGEPKFEPELRPSVLRDDFAASESMMLLDLIARRPEEFNRMTSALSKWVLAQHHGLKTRFLDITKNPLVAMFYACEKDNEADGRLHIFGAPRSLIKPFNSDTVSVIANFARLTRDEQDMLLGRTKIVEEHKYRPGNYYQDAMHRLCELIQEEKPNFENRIDVRDLFRVIVVEPQQSSERIEAQSSAFLVSAFHERLERGEILKWNDGIPVYAHYTLTIPAKYKASILDDLQLFNISRETLFPGLDSSASAITERYKRGTPN